MCKKKYWKLNLILSRAYTQRSTLNVAAMSFIRLAARRIVIPRYTPNTSRFTNLLPPRAAFSAAAGLSKDEIQTRILEVVKGFEKVDPAKVSSIVHLFLFRQQVTSLLADSDVVILERFRPGQSGRGRSCNGSRRGTCLFVRGYHRFSWLCGSLQEFSIEIPDAEADEIQTVQQGQKFKKYSSANLTFFGQLSTILLKHQKVRWLI